MFGFIENEQHTGYQQNPNQFFLVCSWEWPRGNLLGNNISLVWIMICGFRRNPHIFLISSFIRHSQRFPHWMKNIIGSHLYILFHRKSFQSARFFGCEHVFSAMPLYKKSISWNNSKEKFEYQILNLKPIKVVLWGKMFWW